MAVNILAIIYLLCDSIIIIWYLYNTQPFLEIYLIIIPFLLFKNNLETNLVSKNSNYILHWQFIVNFLRKFFCSLKVSQDLINMSHTS